MASHTQKVDCEKCGSDDCNHTVTTGEFASFKLTAVEVFCNHCTYYTRRLVVDGKEVANERR